MHTPENLQYSNSHEWIQDLGGSVRIGLTDYAQHAMSDLVFVNLPDVGAPVTAGESFTDVESVKAVADIYSPVTGEITAVNEALLDSPELINSDPYGAWLVEIGSITDTEELLDAAAYDALCAEEAEA